MSNEQQNMYITRIQQKHDTEENWTKYDFTPMAGEIVVYDKDTTNTEVRFKIGDGNTPLSELPFAGISTINDESVDGNNSIKLTGSNINVSNTSNTKIAAKIESLDASKANKADTLAGYGIKDTYYTTGEIDSKLATKLNNDLKVNNQSVDETNSITLNSSNITVDQSSSLLFADTVTGALEFIQNEISSIQGGGSGAAILEINGETPTNGAVTLTGSNIDVSDSDNNSIANKIGELATKEELATKANKTETFMRESEKNLVDKFQLTNLMGDYGDTDGDGYATFTYKYIIKDPGIYKIVLTYFNLKRYDKDDSTYDDGTIKYQYASTGGWSVDDKNYKGEAIVTCILLPDSTSQLNKEYTASFSDESISLTLNIKQVSSKDEDKAFRSKLSFYQTLTIPVDNYVYSTNHNLTVTKIMSF